MSERDNTPAHYLLADCLKVFELGQNPKFGHKVIEYAGLNNPEPDGLTLGQRLMRTSALDNVSDPTDIKYLEGNDTIPLDLEDTMYLVRSTMRLADTLVEGTETDQELALAITMTTMVVLQIEREGDICPLARNLATKVSASRPELINPNILK